MTRGKEVAREISYAHSATSRSGAALIRVMENVTGRLGLIRKALGYEHEVAQGRDFWEVMVERYRLSLDVMGGSLENIPKSGSIDPWQRQPPSKFPEADRSDQARFCRFAAHRPARQRPRPAPVRAPDGGPRGPDCHASTAA